MTFACHPCVGVSNAAARAADPAAWPATAWRLKYASPAGEPPGSPFGQTTVGAPIFTSPPQQSLQLNTGFRITQKWSAQWTTTYDMVRSQFASNQVSLQRELHDWRAVFAVTQSPNGNFSFNFFIALKAEPDLKFDYNRQTVRGGAGGFGQFP